MNKKAMMGIVTAVILSQNSNSTKRCNHVAIVTKRNRIVSIGTNSDKTHPMAKTLKIAKQTETMCAELAAALKIGLSHKEGLPDFRGLTMTVVRVGNNGELRMSKPCSACQKLLSMCNFKRVIYSNADGELVRYA